MNLSNPGGWKKRRDKRKRRLSHSPTPEAREIRRKMRDGEGQRTEQHAEYMTDFAVMTRDDLLEYAKNHGIKADRRLSKARLCEKITEAAHETATP